MLEISTWTGLSPGAVHFYGTICHYDGEDELQQHRLEQPMSAKEAARRRKRDRRAGYTYTSWRAGQPTTGFDSSKDIIAAARKVFREICPRCRVLLRGSFGVGGPQAVLIGPRWFKTAGNHLHREAVACGWWEGSPRRMRKLEREWDSLLKDLEIEENDR